MLLQCKNLRNFCIILTLTTGIAEALSLPKVWLPVVTTSAVTIPGSDPQRPQKVNQDAFFSNGLDFIGVMDGHGLNGHLVTNFLKLRFPHRLTQYTAPNHTMRSEEDVTDQEFADLLARQNQDIMELGRFEDCRDDANGDFLAEGLIKAFLAVHLDARRDPAIPTGRSGSTAIVAMLDTRTCCTPSNSIDLYVAGVGDSSAILVNSAGAVQNLLPKTTVDLDSERKRIEIAKGRIVGRNVFHGPVGMAMTRALGDTVMLPAGVVPVPMVHKSALMTKDRYCVCLGSDGVFDVLSNEKVAALIHSSGILDGTTPVSVERLHDIAQSIGNEARRAWQADLPIETSVDDITCALMTVIGP